ncbi:uncharacterized protein STEHIDRAFT_113868 [Stereum hirsutum FP-91666 SS1]|uniref:uncharacterized protein n=1 Tax=Stereum hirsutum (strain FP-91666) TaxID=721885 RepID=UPI0004449CFB|nr:uncharacterized protein STEHIDRAFT_113868 [Stereum hirsutum FP-91666 SS1]EIM82758.1 hypothetical protein STEHIDRAFT_113868 [Stereum hirsutum FP-91666 SS1]
MVYGYPTPINAFNDREALLARRPSSYSEEHAYKEMHQTLMSYVKKYWPEVYAQIPQDGRRYWPEILMDDSPDPVDEDLEVNTRGETGSGLLSPVNEDDSDSATSIMVWGYPTPLNAFNDLDALLQERPSNYPEDIAYDEMHQALMSYVEEYWPDVYAQIPKDGKRYWPRIIMDDTPDEDLGVNSRGKTGSDPLDPLDEDDSSSANSESSGDVAVPP